MNHYRVSVLIQSVPAVSHMTTLYLPSQKLSTILEDKLSKKKWSSYVSLTSIPKNIYLNIGHKIPIFYSTLDVV